MTKTSYRYPEIDLLRTVAIELMIIYHTLFDLEFLYGSLRFDLSSEFWHLFQVIAASLFLLLVGISFVLSYQRVCAHPSRAIYKRYFLRGLRIIGYGMIVTIATYFFDQQEFIRFGILHLIGVSILLLPFAYRLHEGNVTLGFVIIALGPWIAQQTVSTNLLLPLGFRYPGFSTLDYFPIFPWLGVLLIGLGIGYFLFVRCSQWRTAAVDTFFDHRVSKILGFPGRYSLFIYLVHQPLILLVLTVLYGWPKI